MANPKRRHSSARQAKRRANWKLKTSNLSVCTHCKMPKLPHRICPHCGYYKGKPVLVKKEKEDKTKKGKK